MTGTTMIAEPASPPLTKTPRRFPGLPSPPLTPDSSSSGTADSPTGVIELFDEFMSSREEETNASVKQLMANKLSSPASDDDDREKRQSLLRKNADMTAPGSADRRRLSSMGLMGDNSDRHSLMETIRRQREEDKAMAQIEMNRRQLLEKKNSANKVASKYSGLSRGLWSTEASTPLTPASKDSLMSFLASDDAKKSLKLSSSFSGLSGLSGDMDSSFANSTGSSRVNQRWSCRETYSRLNNSATLLSGGLVQTSQMDKEDEDDGETSTPETHTGTVDSQESDSEDEEEEEAPMKDKSFRIVDEPIHTPPPARRTSISNQSTSSSNSNSKRPKGILKRSSTIGSVGSATGASTPLRPQSAHQTETNQKRTILSALYDEKKNMNLQALTVDNSTGHQRRSNNEPITPPTTRQSRDSRRSSSSRKLDGSRRGDSSRRLDSSRREGSSRKLRSGSSSRQLGEDSVRSSRMVSSRRERSTSRDDDRSSRKHLSSSGRDRDSSNDRSSRGTRSSRRERSASRDDDNKSSRHLSSSRRDRDSSNDDARDHHVSRNKSMRDTSSRTSENQLSRSRTSDSNGSDGRHISRSSSGKRLASMSRAQSARRIGLTKKKSSKTLEKQPSCGSRISQASEEDGSRTSHKRSSSSTTSLKVHSPKEASKQPKAFTQMSKHRRGGDAPKPFHEKSKHDRPGGKGGRDRDREDGDRGRRTRSRSRSRTRQRTVRAGSRSRSRARRQTTKKPDPSELAAAAAAAADRIAEREGNDDTMRGDTRTSRRRPKMERKARSERSVRRRSSLRGGESSHKDDDRMEAERVEEDEKQPVTPVPMPDDSQYSHMDESCKSKKSKRKSMSMKLPLWGKKKTHQPIMDTSNSSSKY